MRIYNITDFLQPVTLKGEVTQEIAKESVQGCRTKCPLAQAINAQLEMGLISSVEYHGITIYLNPYLSEGEDITGMDVRRVPVAHADTPRHIAQIIEKYDEDEDQAIEGFSFELTFLPIKREYA